jgi:hypothetical protein
MFWLLSLRRGADVSYTAHLSSSLFISDLVRTDLIQLFIR